MNTMCHNPDMNVRCHNPDMNAMCHNPDMNAMCHNPDMNARCHNPDMTLQVQGIAAEGLLGVSAVKGQHLCRTPWGVSSHGPAPL